MSGCVSDNNCNPSCQVEDGNHIIFKISESTLFHGIDVLDENMLDRGDHCGIKE
jgi:hypothetical protein